MQDYEIRALQPFQVKFDKYLILIISMAYIWLVIFVYLLFSVKLL
ncbi:hypothetical protein PFLA_a2637 [Pseudoalteromonas flavipulchra NCIMB 2033 = ATCC BAA-314]|nr:hypothetical protein [Pseudoalteromonas flavipulchra NCIMB 2033 = ATCC BAA-314]